MLGSIRWTRAETREFTGRFLTEPRAQVHFERPARPLARAAFARRGAARGVALHPASRLGFSGTIFFLNGEAAPVRPEARAAVRRLADARRLAAPVDAPAAFWDAAHAWYLQGFLALDGDET